MRVSSRAVTVGRCTIFIRLFIVGGVSTSGCSVFFHGVAVIVNLFFCIGCD